MQLSGFYSYLLCVKLHTYVYKIREHGGFLHSQSHNYVNVHTYTVKDLSYKLSSFKLTTVYHKTLADLAVDSQSANVFFYYDFVQAVATYCKIKWALIKSLHV